MMIEGGSTNVSLFVYFVDDVGGTNAGEPTTGLLFSDIETGGSASYARQGAARVDLTLITLASASAAHADGGFILLDDTNMPGIYRVDYPDAAFATGVDMTVIQLVAASGKNTVMRPLWVEIGTVQTDLDNATDGLGALKTLIDTVNTDLANGTDGLGALKALIDTVNTDLANGTDGLGALKALIDTVNTDLSNGTDGLGALKILIDALNDITAAVVMTTQMTESYAADGTAPTPAQALLLILAMVSEFSISGTTLTAKKLDGSATAGTFTLSDATNPTSITRAS